MVVGEPKALPIGISNDIVWSAYDFVLYGSDMAHDAASGARFENLDNRVSAYIDGLSPYWCPVVYKIYIEQLGV